MSPYFEVGEFIKPSGLTGLVDLYLCYWTYTRDMRSAMLLKSFHSSNPSNYVRAFTTSDLLSEIHPETAARHHPRLLPAEDQCGNQLHQLQRRRVVPQ